METPRSSRSTRRSYPNLHNLSLAPLSSNYPVLDASQPPSPSSSHNNTSPPRTSYIAQKSAPTTPGILSLSQSRSNSRRRHHHNPNRPTTSYHYHYDGYFLNPDVPLREAGDIPKAKSTSAMIPGVSFADDMQITTGGRHHKRKGTAPIPLRLPMAKYHTNETSDDWLHRAGLAIAGETRESKGQSWLVRRESSTSLVGQTDEYEEHASHDTRRMALLSGEHLADGDAATFTPRFSSSKAGSRIPSRVGSRVTSARNSRRGSRVGSRVDLMMSGIGGTGASARHSFEMERGFEDVGDGDVEPDFVDDDESDGDEEEVARLARERGFGLGGWMDRLIGWTLFSVDEDGEESDEEDEEDIDNNSTNNIDSPLNRPENMTKEELRLRREVEAKRRKLEREAIIAASALKGTEDEEGTDSDSKLQRPNEENGGWQDAAWLFSVASKVIL